MRPLAEAKIAESRMPDAFCFQTELYPPSYRPCMANSSAGTKTGAALVRSFLGVSIGGKNLGRKRAEQGYGKNE